MHISRHARFPNSAGAVSPGGCPAPDAKCGLLVWDNFESVREMPDPAGATPPLDEAGCAVLKDFLAWARDQSASAVLVTSRAQEDWLGQVRRIGVGGLNLPEAADLACRP